MCKVIKEWFIGCITIQVILVSNAFGYSRYRVSIIRETKYSTYIDYPVRHMGIIAYDRPEIIPDYARYSIAYAFDYIDKLEVTK